METIKHNGLQENSVDGFYPYSIRFRGIIGGESYRIEPYHCVTGKIGPAFYVNSDGFHSAYLAAENWIRKQYGPSGYNDFMKELSELSGCVNLTDFNEYPDSIR